MKYFFPTSPRKVAPNRRFLTIAAVFASAIVGLFAVVDLFSPHQQASGLTLTTFTVTNTADSGSGSLRQAILDANANAGPDTISFNIAGTGVHTISPITALPAITDPVVIDGYTQPGSSPNTLADGNNAVLLIELSGNNIDLQGNVSGISIRTSNCIVRGLVINRFSSGAGIVFSGSSGSIITNNLVEGSFVGTNPSGTVALANSEGINIQFSSNTLVGGTTAAARNIISGNGSRAVSALTQSSATTIQGNFIGTNANGTAALSNNSGGVFVGGLGNDIIGGTTAGARNVISGNLNNAGIFAAYGSSGSVTIHGNLIGTDVTGTVAVPNHFGIWISHGPSGATTTIGGTAPGARNVISGNRSDGLFISGSTRNSQIQTNLIGTDVSGTKPLGNSRNGIRIEDTAANNRIGGTSPGQGNTIAFNGHSGVFLLFSPLGTGNSIRRNSIFSNANLGIDLAGDGVTANDLGDGDSGPNNLQNFPLITSVTGDSSQTTIAGTLNSTPNTLFNVHFYSSSACDPSGNGEGTNLFALISVLTDASGNGIFNVSIPAPLPAGQVLTAIATDPIGNTSEFSPCDSSKATGSVQFETGSLKVIEDVGFVTVNVLRTGGSKGVLAVDYTTADITAAAGLDYVLASGTLTFNEGETSKSFDIPILDDAITEVDESFAVRLQNPPNIDSLGYPSVQIITLQDHDTPPALSINDVSVEEGDSGTTSATFTVTISALTGRTASVNYQTTAGTATSNADFQSTSGTLMFAARQSTQTIAVPVIGDTVIEPNEGFSVNLSNSVNATIADAQGTGTILNDDASIQVEFTSYNFSEGVGNAQVHVKRTGDTSGTSSVSFTTGGNSYVACDVINGGAVQNCDFILNQGTLTFAAGQTDRSINILLIDDAYVEGSETLSLTLSNAMGASLGTPNSATLTITDNDTAGASVPAAKTFIAALAGSLEVPPTGSAGNGGSVVQLDAPETSAKVGLIFSNLSSAEMAAHIHGPAAVGANAGILFPLPLGTVTDFAINPTAQQVSELKAGLHYVNVHSSNFTNGEIRGQLLWNPLNEVDYFVRQHYYDFLGRLPDQGGLDFWTNEMKQCGTNVQCLRDKSVDVSNAFFYEQEYQQTASYVFLLYRAAYGNDQPFPNPDPANLTEAKKLPRYLTFVRDRAQVVGGSGLAASQLALANAFVQRPEFVARYPLSLATGAQFVDAVLATVLSAGTTLATADRDALITNFNNGGRGLVMFHLANDYWNGCNRLPGSPAAPCVAPGFGASVDNRVFIDAEYNRSFVYSQYSGYLRRDGDIAGFLFWLNQVSTAPPRNAAKQHGMVCAFITSAEYQFRFGNKAPRTNGECQASPAPAPQNRKIAFLSSQGLGGFNYEIYTMNPDGSQSTRLTFDIPNFEFPRDFAWSPDGSRIAYELNGLSRNRIVLMYSDGSGARNLTTGTTDEVSPAWSPNGSQIAFAGEDGIYVARVSDGQVTKLANAPSRGPVWSPDGSRIAYTAEVNNRPQVFVMNADGSNQTNLSNSAAEDGSPRWSPDGMTLLFIRQGVADSGLFLMNPDGLNQRKLTSMVPSAHGGVWSPNGDKILFSSGPGLVQIYRINADGSGLIRLTNNSAQDVGPQWSPDSQKIVFISDRDHSGSFGLFIMNSDGSNQTRLNDSGDNSSPQWQPQG